MSTLPQSVETAGRDTEVLEALRKTRTALLLKVPTSDLVYTSYLLKIRRDVLLIDQLMPAVGDQLLQPGVELGLQTAWKGIRYWFQAQHLGNAVDESGFPYHIIARPAHMESEDKRSSYRIPIPRAQSPDCRVATVSGQSGHSSQARLEDISEGGACLRLTTDRAPRVIGGTVDFALDFAPHGELHCQARVCYLQPVARTNQTRVGITFRGLSLKESRDLRRIVMKLQRRVIRGGFIK